MTLEEVEQTLPNGFHDSKIIGLRLDYVQRTAEIDLEICVSGPDDAAIEEYRSCTLLISELIYFVIEPPDTPYAADSEPWLVDGGSTELEQSAYPLPNPLPAGAFTYWFFVSNWNSFIHVGAMRAELKESPSSAS
jgi:hypothetical protein